MCFQALAIFAGVGIRNTKIYDNTVKAIAKCQVAMEVLSYHASVPVNEVGRIQVCIDDFVRSIFK